ncbi:MAG: glycyl radical protein [Anaerolineales bacterium]|nr:glycyl radical protein [Anaerolineales bacterium]
MTDRVKHLREQSLAAQPALSPERAMLLTAYTRESREVSPPIQRAKAFRYLLEHKAICINPGELIVGEKGPAPKAAPTYPELCCHSMTDLNILNTREKIPFSVDGATFDIYERELIPFWKGRTMRERIFAAMSDEWKAAYEAGVFTEFMEQRSPGHTVLDDKIYHRGMLDFKKDIQQALTSLDHTATDEGARRDQLTAMDICADAIICYAERHAEAASRLAAHEVDPARKTELGRIATVCRRVPAHAPRDYYEALQSYWFIHLGVTIELNPWDAFNPGRLDQHLLPFYRQGLEEGTLSREQAEELLQCFWIKFNNQPAPPKVGVTAAESSTYTDFAQINTGGLKADGTDAVNAVTFLLLDVIEEMRLLQPSSSIQVSAKSPDPFLLRAARIIRTGYGQPSVFNFAMIVQELVRQGKSIEDARCGGSSGCVEVGAFGKENYNLTGYFNMPKVLEITLNNGLDPRTGERIGVETGNPADFKVFDDFFSAFELQLNHFIEVKIEGNHKIERLYAEQMPVPFLSLLIDDCIASGKDYHDGGARYNTSYIQGVGLGTMTDALAAIERHIYAEKTFTMEALLKALQRDFEGEEANILHNLLNHSPKYGNDDDAADALMLRLFDAYFYAIDGRPNTRGGVYHINLLPTTAHIYFGSVIGATPDGRRAGSPLSEGVSPVQGADRHGPTAVMKSVAKMDHVRTGGTLLNQKLTPQVLSDDENLEKWIGLIRGFFQLGGHHVQFNVVDQKTLLEAKANPARHRDLIVRVAGYSDYFCDLSPVLQDEIISRTGHDSL